VGGEGGDITTNAKEIQRIIKEYFENIFQHTGKSTRNGYISRCT
jgi:hypothetical protein